MSVIAIFESIEDQSNMHVHPYFVCWVLIRRSPSMAMYNYVASTDLELAHSLKCELFKLKFLVSMSNHTKLVLTAFYIRTF